MTTRAWTCETCGCRFATDADGALVLFARLNGWCRACQRLLAGLC